MGREEDQKTQGTQKKRIPSLDGLRGVAILTVLLGHGIQSVHFLPAKMTHVVEFVGATGVCIFFVLSGFSIHALSVAEVRRTGSFDFFKFYQRRVLRIFPTFYFYISVLGVLMACHAIALEPSMLIAAVTFSLNYRHLWAPPDGAPNHYVVVGHFWTMSLIEQFYLIWPLLILLKKKNRLLQAMLIVVLIMPFMRTITYFLAPGSRGQTGMMFHTACDAIATGVLLGELLARPKARAVLERLASRRSLVIGALVYLFILVPLLSSHLGGKFELPVGGTLQQICVALVVVAAISFPGTWLYRLLNTRVLIYLGMLSFSLYVWNNLFLLGPFIGWLGFPFNAVVLFGVALASHHFIELPFLKLRPSSRRIEPAPLR